jgi:two-component system chemotaxis response regulator CheB
VILTGANRDGARGLAAIKSLGGSTIVEDPRSAACGEMPEAAITLTTPDCILPLHEIAPRLIELSESGPKPSQLSARRVSESAAHYGS